MEKVNIFVGRFQPFHKGHLQCCKDIYDKTKLPVVIFYMTNKTFDKRKPFNDDLIEKELNMIKSKYDFIKDIIWLSRPLPMLICNILKEHNYSPNYWIAGEDRIDGFKKMIDKVSDRIENELNVSVPKLEMTKRYCSATEVRNAITNDDFEKYYELMPDKIRNDKNLYNEFKEQINKINESNQSFLNISNYIKNKL